MATRTQKNLLMANRTNCSVLTTGFSFVSVLRCVRNVNTSIVLLFGFCCLSGQIEAGVQTFLVVFLSSCSHQNILVSFTWRHHCSHWASRVQLLHAFLKVHTQVVHTDLQALISANSLRVSLRLAWTLDNWAFAILWMVPKAQNQP